MDIYLPSCWVYVKKSMANETFQRSRLFSPLFRRHGPRTIAEHVAFYRRRARVGRASSFPAAAAAAAVCFVPQTLVRLGVCAQILAVIATTPAAVAAVPDLSALLLDPPHGLHDLI